MKAWFASAAFIFIAVVQVAVATTAYADGYFDRNYRTDCYQINQHLKECATPKFWERTFAGNLPVASVRYVYTTETRVLDNVIGQITFTPASAGQLGMSAEKLSELALDIARLAFVSNGADFEIVAQEITNPFGVKADQTAVFTSAFGAPMTAVYTTFFNKNELLQFTTIRGGHEPSHVDYRLHQDFLSKFQLMR
jgi:hypothetical protein